MNLLQQIKQTQTDAKEYNRQLVQDLAVQHANSWKTLILNDAKAGKKRTYFTEMTCLLAAHLKGGNVTDLTTKIYLELIAEQFRAEGLVVSKPYEIDNPNGYQMRIDVSWAHQ